MRECECVHFIFAMFTLFLSNFIFCVVCVITNMLHHVIPAMFCDLKRVEPNVAWGIALSNNFILLLLVVVVVVLPLLVIITIVIIIILLLLLLNILLLLLSPAVQVWRRGVQLHADVVDEDELPVDDVPLWLGHQATPGASVGRQDHAGRIPADSGRRTHCSGRLRLKWLITVSV